MCSPDEGAGEASDTQSQLDPSRSLFCEFFAGEGPLTSAVAAAGVPTRSPDDLASGGTDFEDKHAVDNLRRELGSLAASGVRLVVHLLLPVPPSPELGTGRSLLDLGLGSFHKVCPA